MILLAIALSYSDPIGRIIADYEKRKVIETSIAAKKAANEVLQELKQPKDTTPCKAVSTRR